MAKKQSDLFRYLKQYGSVSMERSPFNEVDALILSILSYLDFGDLHAGYTYSFTEAIRLICLRSDHGHFDQPGQMKFIWLELARQVCRTKRFAKMKVCEYTECINEQIEMQFSAVTFLLPDQTAFIAFRGTDNTLVGWKEDLNMSYIPEVPSQTEACRYLERVLPVLNCPVRAGGHSKGGNLAVWSCAHLPFEQKEQIMEIYSHDGPGFHDTFIESRMYLEIQDKVKSFVPDSSIIGVLLNQDRFTTIASSNPPILQHDPMSWRVSGTSFIEKKKRTPAGRLGAHALNSWVRSMPLQDKKEFASCISEMMKTSDAKTWNDLELKSVFGLISAFKNLDASQQAQLLYSLKKLIPEIQPSAEWSRILDQLNKLINELKSHRLQKQS